MAPVLIIVIVKEIDCAKVLHAMDMTNVRGQTVTSILHSEVKVVSLVILIP